MTRSSALYPVKQLAALTLAVAALLAVPFDAHALKAPANLIAQSTSSSSIRLTWTDRSTDETGYEIARSTSSKTSTLKTVHTTGPNATSWDDSGLISNTRYYYRARARNGTKKTGWTKVANATTQLNPVVVPPSITGQPSNQTVTAPASATFAVVASGTAPLTYQWQRNGVPVSGATGSSYTTPATSTADSGSVYRVLVSNSAGTATSATASLTVNAAPDTTAPSRPTGLSATAAACDRIDLSWDASTDSGGSGLWGYYLYRDDQLVKQVQAPAVSTSDNVPSASTRYVYTARSIDNAGNLSTESAARAATTPACPDTAPPSVSVVHSPGSPTTNDAVALTATAADASGIDNVAITLDGNVVRSCSSSPCSYTAGAPIAAGTHSYSASATDASSNHNVARDPVSGSKTFNATAQPAFNPKLVGSVPGLGGVTDIAVSGSNAFASSDTFGLSVAGVGDPSDIDVVGSSDKGFAGGHVATTTTRAVVTGTVAGLARVWVLDISDPDDPRVLGELPTTAPSILDVAINSAGTRAAVAVGATGIWVLDISNPAAPTKVGSFDTAGTAFAVALNSSGSLAHVADGAGGLKVVDLSNQSAPNQVGSLTMSGIQRDIALQGNVAYVADQMGRLVTVNVASASAPSQLGAVVIGRYTFNVAVEGTRVVTHSADSISYLDVINVANPNAPVMQNSIGVDAAGGVKGIALSGGKAYVANGAQGLRVYNLVPSAIGTYRDDFSASQIASNGDRTVVTGAHVPTNTARLRVVDSSNHSKPRVVGNLPSTITAAGFLDVALSAAGDRAAIALGTAGVRIVDLSDPERPSAVATFDTAGTAFAVALNAAGTLAYVADGAGGLKIIGLTNPSAPTMVGNLAISGIQRDVALRGNVAYLADQMGRLVTVNVATPSSASQLGAVTIGRYTFNVAVEGTRVITHSADSAAYLDVFDVANPNAPVQQGSVAVDAAGAVKGLALSGGRAFVADSAGGLKIYSLTNPASPSLLGSGYTRGAAMGVAVPGATALVADSAATVSVTELFSP